ncbi:hypothetical protein Cpir12675_006900 [Ceratocystis pirilliformis]|uniref:Phosphatidylinositol-specific phospholipase C X domain-containing protein n=1 Tax=Ceratocystis pirilliformis TaxID=259994 RepID=A0ABR3YCK6_9PEZI
MRLSLLTTLACLAFSRAGQFKGIDDIWSFDLSDDERFTDWMGHLEDDVLLSQLIIPGTHNSMTDRIESNIFQSQNVPLAGQLLGGIRYIDISCRYIDYDIMVYHGVVNTGYSLGDVLNTMYDFLAEHPRETIILRIQEAFLGDPEAFISFIDRYFVPGTESDNRAAQYIYSRHPGDITIPTLGQARGKILILQDFETNPPGLYGIPWNSPFVSSYNHRIAPGSLFLRWKWKGVKENLSRIPSPYSNTLRITHTTASAGVSPINVAAKNGEKYGMNRHLGRHLMDGRNGCYGVIVMDFPGKNLIQEMMWRNDRYRPYKTVVTDFLDHTAPVMADEFDFRTVSVDEAPPVGLREDQDEASDDEFSPTLVR